jgi:hypothetical protein
LGNDQSAASIHFFVAIQITLPLHHHSEIQAMAFEDNHFAQALTQHSILRVGILFRTLCKPSARPIFNRSSSKFGVVNLPFGQPRSCPKYCLAIASERDTSFPFSKGTIFSQMETE